MKDQDYPYIYRFSNDNSMDYQSRYMWLIGVQYGAVFAASVIAILSNFERIILCLYIILILISMTLSVYEFFKENEKCWYGFRAIAESAKTTTWKCMMVTSPFDGSDKDAESEFCRCLEEIVFSNNQVLESNSIEVDDITITDKMKKVRNLSLNERYKFYLKYRINEQYSWYIKKANINKKSYITCLIICVICQSAAIFSAILQVIYMPNEWPLLFQPLLVFVATLFGWMQVKKFKELESAYSLAANEIGIIRDKFKDTLSEEDFAKFINDAESAFSREHTQWAARRSG